jgi:iron(III) transport system substrate-binding protein
MAALYEAAKTEGKLVLYGGNGPIYRKAQLEEFQKAYPGIQVEFTGGFGTAEAARLVQERAAGQYTADVFTSATTQIVVTLKEAGAVEPLAPILLPENANPSAWHEGKLQWADQNEPLTTLMYGCTINEIVYLNPRLADPKQFTSYKDLLDPRWKDKIAGTDPREPGFAGVASRFMYKNPDLGPAYMTQLYRDTNIVLSADQRQLIDWVVQGTYPIGLSLSPQDVLVAQRQGLPVQGVPVEQFKEGAVIGPGYGDVALMNRAPNPKAAQLYINWLLSQDGQKTWQTVTGEPSCRTDIGREGTLPEKTPKPGVTYVNAGTEEYSRLTGGVIRDLVNEALGARPKS